MTWWTARYRRRWLAAAALLALSGVGGCADAATAPPVATPTTLGVTTTAAEPASGVSTPVPSTPVPSSTGPSTDRPPTGAPATVVSVTDGDTLRVRLEPGGVVETLRLIGIDAPEVGECFGAEATEALERLVGGGAVGLTTDVSDRDRFGRLLRHVWIADGRSTGEELVRSGHAISRAFPPDTAMSDRLTAAQEEAEAADRGLWSPDACGAATGSAVEIAHIEYDAPGDDSLNLNEEWIDIRNHGDTAAHLTGWVVKDESASHRFGFPAGFVLDTGASVRIRTGCGEDTDLELYWCNESSAVWNNSGDTGFLLDPNGNIVDTLGF